MADVKPFRAVRYDTHLTGPLSSVVSPPYDVIDEAYRAKLASRSAFQFVHVDLPTAVVPGEAADARYRRAAATYESWKRSGVLRADEAPGFYVYWQTFSLPNGQRVTRKGFLGLTRIHAYEERVILPHERTLSGPKADRLALMEATEAQLSQIFLLYHDPSGLVDRALELALPIEPVCDMTWDDGIRNQVWAVTDPAAIVAVTEALAGKRLLIADGHHRYETAMAYAAAHGGASADDPAHFTLAFFANAADPGLVVLPTHRGIHDVAGFKATEWLERAGGIFKLDELDPSTAPAAWLDILTEAGSAGTAFVFVLPDAGHVRAVLARLDSSKAGEALSTMRGGEALRSLDVSVLHDLVLERQIGISREAQAAKTNIHYFKEAAALVAEVASGEVQLGVLMNGTPVAKVREVCEAGDFMPQKSTFFYPKVLSGVVVHDLKASRGG
jgi:uncharacterized protein (DUF1015 family)